MGLTCVSGIAGAGKAYDFHRSEAQAPGGCEGVGP
jgi:hypothetical protein